MSSAFQSNAWQSDAFQIPGGVLVRVLDCDPGEYLIDGTDADFSIVGSLTISCDPSSYLVTGAPLDFVTGDGLLDPKYAARRRRYPNVTFTAPPKKKREREPVVARAPAPPQRPRPQASGLLLGLLDTLIEPVVDLAPPTVEPEEINIPGPLELLADVVLLPEPPAPVDPIAELELRMNARIAALTAEVAQLRARVDVEPEPVQASRDPLHDAMLAMLPALREPVAMPLVDEARQAADAADALRRENLRRAQELAEMLMRD